MLVWRIAALLGVLMVSGGHGHDTPLVRRVTPRIGAYSQPAISGDTIVWFDGRRARHQGRIPGIDIYGRSLRTGREFRVTSSPTADEAGTLLVSGKTVLWDDCRHCRLVGGFPGYAGDQMFMRNIATGREYPLPLHWYGQFGPWLVSGLAIWGRRHGRGPVRFYAADSVSGRPRPLATDAIFRKMLLGCRRQVVWRAGFDLQAGDLLSGRTYILARHGAGESPLTDPIISGQRAIWTRWPPRAPVSIDGIDLVSGKRFRVATLPANHYNPQLGPDKTILGHVVVWVESLNPMSSRDPHFVLAGKDIVTRHSIRLASGSYDQAQPAASGHQLVYLARFRGPGHIPRSLIVERRLPSSTECADPIQPMQFRGGD